VAEKNLDEIGRRLRAPGSQQANAEELLAELVRLVDSSGLALGRSPPLAETVSKPGRTDTEPMPPLEMTSLHPSVERPQTKPGETGAVDVEPARAPNPTIHNSNDPNGINLATGRRSGAWTFKVSVLVLAGAGVIGSIFWLKQVQPGLPKAPPFIATAQGLTKGQPRSDLTVVTLSDAGATPLSDVTQPAQVKVVGPEKRPIDLNARASLNNPPPSADLGPTVTGAAQPTADASAGKPPAVPVNTTAVAAPIAASPRMASQSLDSKPGPPVSLPTDPTPIAMPTPSATDSGVAAHASDAPLPPVRPGPKAASEAAGVAQRSTPKLDLPTKLSSKSAAHVVVAKADATGIGAPVKTPSEPLRLGASVKPEKGATTLKAAQAPAEAQAVPPEQPVPAQQPNPNPVVRAFSNMVGALTGLIPFATR
jgi:hypothetical protein